MRKIYTYLIACCVGLTGSAQQLSHRLDEVVVSAKRPTSEIGVQKLSVDSTALRENIALSMADIIGYNSSVFVKTSGRSTLSTVSFRGTAPSHTAVSWNGIPINSPALGMTDFSLIPSYFVDQADLLYGTSALGKVSGALGGMVDLSTDCSQIPNGFNLQYVQGAGSFTTFDEFLRIGYGSDNWKLSTRAVFSSSHNDFTFINHDKKENIYDDDYNIISQYFPKEKNRNGAYHDFHILQQAYYIPKDNQQFGLNVWYTNSYRQLPLTTVDYLESRVYKNYQRDNSLRSVLDYKLFANNLKLNVKVGYLHTSTNYFYGFSLSDDLFQNMVQSRTHINTFFTKATLDKNLSSSLFFNAEAAFTYNKIKTVDHASLSGHLGFSRGRSDVDLSTSLKWLPIQDLGLRALIREDICGGKFQNITPAFFVDYTVYRPSNLMLKASVSRNLHVPTLNDLYFVPGGNPDLKSEKGISYDTGASINTVVGNVVVSGSTTWFDSHISDWILWLPTNKGFFSPRNVRRVHSYGIESNIGIGLKPFKDAYLDIHGSFSWTQSVNDTKPTSDYDISRGKQLPYVPVYSASSTISLTWKQWSLLYKICYYSKRYTMASNENTIGGSLPSYCMNTATLERKFNFNPLNLSLKLAVNNLFDADYQTIKTHPMPGINFEFFVSITPKFNKK